MSPRHHWIIALSLFFLLAATRASHWGSEWLLPDASLAVFLFGGLTLGTAGWFAGLFLLAAGFDILAARTALEVGWCLTPAYWGLLPTYGVLWLAGRWLARTPELPASRYAGVGLVAVTLAFAISNLTFWAFSGHFGGMDLLAYAREVAFYFPSYAGGAALYLALGWLVWRLLTARESPIAAANKLNLIELN